MLHQNQHLSKDLLAPMILGKIISIDDWVPERPPKPKSGSHSNLSLSMRIPSPELPPPPPIESAISPINVDDALPLPPPEVLKQESEMKLSHPPSRRNSFAGLPPKIKTNHIPLSPPAIPMRPKIIPTPIMTVNPNSLVAKSYQPTQDQTVHAQRVILQKHSISDQMMYNSQVLSTPRSSPMLQQQHQQIRASDSRVSVRKRAHNSSSKDCYIVQQTPPPLKPRMRNQNESNIQTQQNVFMPIANNKVR